MPTPATAYRMLQRPPEELLAELAASPVPSARAAAAQLAGLRDHVRAGIVLSVADKLAWLDDPAVLRFTWAEEAAPDFTLLQHHPIGMYWVLHEQDVALLQPLSTLFFTLLIDQLCRSSGPVPVTLLFDEFANIGPVPDFPTTISVARGRGLSLVLGVQTLSQLEGLYGRHGAETVLANCATRVVLHGLNRHSAEEVSRELRSYTLQYEARSTRPYHGDTTVPFPVNETSWSETRIGRPLLTADEVRRLGHDEAIVLVSNQRPIWTKRWWWNREPRTARAYPLDPPKAAALAPPTSTKPSAPPMGAPPEPADGTAKPTLGDLADKLKRLDDDELEDLDFGRERR